LVQPKLSVDKTALSSLDPSIFVLPMKRNSPLKQLLPTLESASACSLKPGARIALRIVSN